MGQESGRRPKFDPEARATQGSGSVPPPGDEHKVFNTTIGEGIRRARQERGWTQAALAEQAGLSPNYIARLERGELGPSLFVANQICLALQIEIDALVAPLAGSGGGRRTAKRRAAG